MYEQRKFYVHGSIIGVFAQTYALCMSQTEVCARSGILEGRHDLFHILKKIRKLI